MEQANPEQTVATGLTETPAPEQTVAVSENPQVASDPAPLGRTVAEVDAANAAVAGDVAKEPEPAPEPVQNDAPINVTGLSETAEAELRGEATRENIKRQFVHNVMEARRKRDAEPPPTQPVPARIMDQTKAEQEAGAAMVRKHEEHRAMHGGPRQNNDGRMAPVLRPGDFVEYKNSFKNAARTVSKDAIAQPLR